MTREMKASSVFPARNAPRRERHKTGNAGNAGHGPWYLVDPADMFQ